MAFWTFVVCVLLMTARRIESSFPRKSMQMGWWDTFAFWNNAVKCWGVNNYGQCGQGHKSIIMTPSDPIDFGTGFIPIIMDHGMMHTCVVSHERDVKCWGRGSHGQLGYGDENHRGDEPGEMGDNLPLVDLPTGTKVKDIALGGYHTCVVSMERTVYCWGNNKRGTLGVGHTNYIGDEPGEMGDNLVATELGSNFEVDSLETNGMSTCAKSTDGRLKCWGWGDVGQLGLGESKNRGDEPGQMGDNLPEVDLGTGFVVRMVSVSTYYSCALSTESAVKCWGRGRNGVLGYGDIQSRGSGSNQMGDYLPVVDLGDGFVTRDLVVTSNRNFAISTEEKVKMWGSKGGSSTGGQPNHMGNNLAFIEIGPEFTGSGLTSAPGNANTNNCIYEETADGLLAKCQSGDRGAMGYPSESGKGRWNTNPLIDFGTWPEPAVLPEPEPEPAPQCDATRTCGRLDVVENAVGRLDGLDEAANRATDRLDALEQAVQSLEGAMAAIRGVLENYGTASGTTSVPLGLTDYVLYALVAANAVMVVCLLVYCVSARLSAPAAYGKVVAYDTVDTEKP